MGIVLVILLAVSPGLSAAQEPLLAAASSLRSVWPDLIKKYISDTGQAPPRTSFGSSGLLSTQILNGAPFELFLSADLASITRLNAQQLATAPQIYALGELLLVVPDGSPLSASLNLSTLADALTATDTQPALRLAIPNPAHAPYGKAARQALVSADIWPLPASRLLAAENAAQTLQFVRTGAVSAAIVPRALLHQHADGVVSAPLPGHTYQPVEHAVALFAHAGDSARIFHDWLLDDRSRQVLEMSGLRVPDR